MPAGAAIPNELWMVWEARTIDGEASLFQHWRLHSPRPAFGSDHFGDFHRDSIQRSAVIYCWLASTLRQGSANNSTHKGRVSSPGTYFILRNKPTTNSTQTQLLSLHCNPSSHKVYTKFQKIFFGRDSEREKKIITGWKIIIRTECASSKTILSIKWIYTF